MKEWILQKINEGVLVQGALAIGTVGGVVYLGINGQPIPDILGTLAGAVMGFYFGAKVNQR